MGWGATAPAAIAGILTVLRGSPDLQGVTILDGPQVDTGAQQVITIGYEDDNAAAAAAEGTLTAEGLAVATSREQYTVQGEVAVLNGDATAVADTRTAAFTLLNGIGAALAANKTLGGVVMWARLGAWTLRQQQSAKGVIVSVVFGIEVEAYTGR